MNIKIKELRAKPYEVKQTFKNLNKTYAFQLAAAKNEVSFESDIEYLESQVKAQELLRDYIVEILHLNKKEIEVLENQEQAKVGEIGSYISMRMMGLTDADIAVSQDTVEDVEGLVQQPQNEK
jgi:hypothetical protein